MAVVQVLNLQDLFDVKEVLTAGYAKGLVLGYALAVGAIFGSACLLPKRWLIAPVLLSSVLAAVALTLTFFFAGQFLAFAIAALTMATCWELGRWLLKLLKVYRLAELPLAAWLCGTTLLGLFVLGIGAIGMIRWWSIGLPVVVIGGLSVAGAVWRCANPPRQRFKAVRDSLVSSRTSAAAASLTVLTLGLASLWTAAPEVMFDAYYAKAWLPAELARAGLIDSEIFRLHPVLSNFGFSQLLAVPGHTLGAPAVGRFLQLVALGAVVVSVWRFGGRAQWGAVGAVILIMTPQVFWQATTADDDLILVLASIALFTSLVMLFGRGRDQPSVFAVSFAVGVLVGACINLKLHLVALVIAGAVSWWAFGGFAKTRSAIGVCAGIALVASAKFTFIWVTAGNPLMPAFNDFFRSPYWPQVNEKLNLPYLTDPGLLGPVSVFAKSLLEPSALQEAAPVGSVGLVTALVAVAIALGWRKTRPETPASVAPVVLWSALVVATAAWYIQFRYLRYLLPAGAVAVLCLILQTGSLRVRGWVERGLLVGLAALAVLLWPATVAMYWNVPGKDMPIEVVLGSRSEADYERASIPQRDAVEAFNEAAPARALALADPMTRTWLRSGRDITPYWELNSRLASESLRSSSLNLRSAGGLLDAYRAAGVTWVLLQEGSPLAKDPSIEELLASHGELRYRDQSASLYRLVENPTKWPPALRCQSGAALSRRCWSGGAEARPRYAGPGSPTSAWRSVGVCTGQTLIANGSVPVGDAPATVSIAFSAKDPAWAPSVVIRPGTRGTVAAPVPAGAKAATVTIDEPGGNEQVRVGLRKLGDCR